MLAVASECALEYIFVFIKLLSLVTDKKINSFKLLFYLFTTFYFKVLLKSLNTPYPDPRLDTIATKKLQIHSSKV